MSRFAVFAVHSIVGGRPRARVKGGRAQVFSENIFQEISKPQPLLEKSIKMTPAETARALFYFSPHNNARPTPVGDAAKHIHLPHAREYQGQTPPRS